MSGESMEVMTLVRRVSGGRSRSAVPLSSSRGGFAEIFAYGDASVQPITDLASAAYEIRRSHPLGADLILIGRSAVQGMKTVQDLWGVSVLIGLPPATLQMFYGGDGDEVLIAFDQGALRPAGIIGFLWEGGSGPETNPPESNSTLTRSRLDAIRHRRLNLA